MNYHATLLAFLKCWQPMKKHLKQTMQGQGKHLFTSCGQNFFCLCIGPFTQKKKLRHREFQVRSQRSDREQFKCWPAHFKPIALLSIVKQAHFFLWWCSYNRLTKEDYQADFNVLEMYNLRAERETGNMGWRPEENTWSSKTKQLRGVLGKGGGEYFWVVLITMGTVLKQCARHGAKGLYIFCTLSPP